MPDYVTRTGTVGGDPSSGVETELTANFDDASPGRYNVPASISRVVEIRVVVSTMVDASDEAAMHALRLKGAVSISPTIVIGAGGLGTAGTGYSEPVLQHSFAFTVDIPLQSGKNLEIYLVSEGSAAADSEVSVTLVLV